MSRGRTHSNIDYDDLSEALEAKKAAMKSALDEAMSKLAIAAAVTAHNDSAYDDQPIESIKSAPPRGRATVSPSKRKIIKASRRQNRRKKR